MVELLTVSEVAKLLKVKSGQIYRLKAEHKIPFVKVGGAVRFNLQEIENWICAQSKGVEN